MHDQVLQQSRAKVDAFLPEINNRMPVATTPPPDGGEYLFRSDKFQNQLTRSLKEMRDADEQCDVMLVSDLYPEPIPAHKVILSASSPYFRAMFRPKKEPSSTTTTKKTRSRVRISVPHLDAIVDYCYKSEILLNRENAVDIIEAARHLKLEELEEGGWQFCARVIDLHTCILLEHFANVHGRQALTLQCRRFIEKHISKVVATEEFLKLPVDRVIELINMLEDTSEEVIFEAILTWVKHSHDRKQYFSALIEEIEFSLISSDYLADMFHGDSFLREYAKFDSSLLNRISPEAADMLKKKAASISDQIIAFGGGRGMSAETFNINKGFWTHFERFTYAVDNAACAVSDNQVFISGGWLKSGFTDEVKVITNYDDTWKELTKMLTPRIDHGMVVIDGNLYVFGGFTNKGKAVPDVEVYDLEARKWSRVPNMLKPVFSFSYCDLNDDLYVIGGDDERQSVKCVQRYDTAVEEWTYLAELNTARSGSCATVCNSKIYVFGGNRTTTAECYDVERNTWRKIKDMSETRCRASAVTRQGLIYVVGGYGLSSVEVYDPRADNWSTLTSKMSAPRSHHCAVLFRPK